MATSYRKPARYLLVAVLTLMLVGVIAPARSSYAAPNAAPKMSALDFRNAMRKLWEDHITWTRLYIVSAVAGLPDKDATAQRLLKNQEDIGNAVKSFYGDAAGNQLTSLLKAHIVGAVKILDAAKAGDNAALQTATNDWYTNANDIAAFLNKANPNNWPLSAVQDMMKMHLDLTIAEAVDQLKGDYAGSVSQYDKVHDEILDMADALSGGIMNQFPDRFTSTASDAETTLRITMRKLWEDHITWTRLYIVSAIAGLPDKDATAQRLLKNQEDIGNAIKSFYGDAAGGQLTALLKTHILGAVKILDAAKAGDNAALQTASNDWYANASDIAAFLNKANPNNWPLSAVQDMMKMHLDLTIAEAVDQLKGDYAGSVVQYDKVHDEILGMADALSGGIVAQFPEQFSAAGGGVMVGMPRTGGADSSQNAALTWALVLLGLVLVVAGGLVMRLQNVRVAQERPSQADKS
jgi:hypothetical protein